MPYAHAHTLLARRPEQRPTLKDAEEVLHRPVVALAARAEVSLPTLLEDFDGRDFVIVLEEGPENWPLTFTWSVNQQLDGMFTEAVNHYSIALYPV